MPSFRLIITHSFSWKYSWIDSNAEGYRKHWNCSILQFNILQLIRKIVTSFQQRTLTIIFWTLMDEDAKEWKISWFEPLTKKTSQCNLQYQRISILLNIMFNASMGSSQDKMTQYTNSSLISDFNSKINSPDQATNTMWKPKIKLISDLNSNCQLPKPGDRSDFNTHKTCW